MARRSRSDAKNEALILREILTSEDFVSKGEGDKTKPRRGFPTGCFGAHKNLLPSNPNSKELPLTSPLFEELDYRPTPIGALSLRRRRILSLNVDVIEILLGEEHLMSDLFTASEIALATLGMQAAKGDSLEIVVGGLGLGYTAKKCSTPPMPARCLWWKCSRRSSNGMRKACCRWART